MDEGDDTQAIFDSMGGPFAFARKDPERVQESILAPLDPTSLDRGMTRDTVMSYFRRAPTPTPDDAWVHLYRLNLRFNHLGLPAIIEAPEDETRPWKARAMNCHSFLARAWGVPKNEVAPLVNLVLRNDPERSIPNASGHTLEAVVEHLLRTLSAGASARLQAQVYGFTGGIRGGLATRPDLVLYGPSGLEDVRMVITLKWSLRGDRGKQCIPDATSYRRRAPNSKIAVVTNDCDIGRIKSILSQRREDTDNKYLIDTIYHVAPEMLHAAHDGVYFEEGRLRSLADLIRDVEGICSAKAA
jgi:hypothetical protein